MAIRDGLLPEFDHEAATTRRVLERVATEKFDLKPHPKSWTMLDLATHIVNIFSWTTPTLQQDKLDLSGPFEKPAPFSDTQNLLAVFDKNVEDARAAIAGTEDETFAQPWSLIGDGKTIFTMPKAAVLRGFVISHIIHHRGQLSVYLRLAGIPVPSIYGPSGDEPNF